MAEAAAAIRSSNGTPIASRTRTSEIKQALARMLDEKLAQGFEIESVGETQAVVVMKGRRRWFGLTNAASVRYEVTVDAAGRAKSRRL